MKRNSNEFEDLMMKVSASFIKVDSEELDACINDALRIIVLFLKVERGTVGQFDPENGALVITHSFAVEGVDPIAPSIGEQHVPYLVARIRSGQPFISNRPGDLPPAANVDKVETFKVSLLCSAITKIDIRSPSLRF